MQVRRCLTKEVVDMMVLIRDGKLFHICIPLNVNIFLNVSVLALDRVYTSISLDRFRSLVNAAWHLSVDTCTPMRPQHFPPLFQGHPTKFLLEFFTRGPGSLRTVLATWHSASLASDIVL